MAGSPTETRDDAPPTQFERDLLGLIEAVGNRRPPERRSFDRPRVYLGADAAVARAPLMPAWRWLALGAFVGLWAVVGYGLTPYGLAAAALVSVLLLALAAMAVRRLVRLGRDRR